MLLPTNNPRAGLPKGFPPPPVFTGLAFGAQVLLTRRTSGTVGSRIAGAILAGASVLLDIRAALEFRRHTTTLNPRTLDATTLVKTGPYSFTRNPMYLGATGVLVAYAVGHRSSLALVPAALYAIIIDRVQIPAEEVVLHERFGTEYDRYRAVTPRWL
jgi:protein-S-isoprenylcysteine O-methyltransferase Ste14